MRRVDVIAKLKQAEPALRSFGVASLYLFGSHARDEARPDLLWTDPEARPGFTICDRCHAWPRRLP